jgi:hypothetical protein
MSLDRLQYLVTAYFHLDWDIEGPTAEAVVERFAAEENDTTVREACRGAAELLTRTDDEIAAQLDAWRIGYDPAGEGRTSREWVELVRARLGEALPPADRL